jgi:hypothetical protein
MFPALVNLEGDIIQPVIQYGSNGFFGGGYWTAAAWRCTAGDNAAADCMYGPQPLAVGVGDLIAGEIQASSCSEGECLWTITITDETTGKSNVLPVEDDQFYEEAVGGAVEEHGLTACSAFPVNGLAFKGEQLISNGAEISPVWSDTLMDPTAPSCSFGATMSVDTVTGFFGTTYQSTITLSENPEPVTALGTATASCPSLPEQCTATFSGISASGAVITFTSNTTTTIKLSGATASGSLSASCGSSTGQCTAGIVSITGSGSTIRLEDSGGHVGTITLTGATASGGLTASCPSQPASCTPFIVGVKAEGSNVLVVTDNQGHTGNLVLQ